MLLKDWREKNHKGSQIQTTNKRLKKKINACIDKEKGEKLEASAFLRPREDSERVGALPGSGTRYLIDLWPASIA